MPLELCARARDRMWECNATATLRRDEPASWRAPLPDGDSSDAPANKWGGGRWQLRNVGGEEVIMDMLPRPCIAMAAQLLGEGGFCEPTGGPFLGRDDDSGAFLAPAGANTRGIYCTLPEPKDAPRVPLRDQPGIHFDSGLQEDSATDARFKVTGEPISAEKNRFDTAANTIARIWTQGSSTTPRQTRAASLCTHVRIVGCTTSHCGCVRRVWSQALTRPARGWMI